MERRTAFTLAMIAAVLGLMCQMISFGCPGWCIVKHTTQPSVSVNMALWYVTICVEKLGWYTSLSTSSCKTSSYQDLFRSADEYYEPGLGDTRVGGLGMVYHQIVEMEVEATIALVACFLGVWVGVKKYRAEGRVSTRDVEMTLNRRVVSTLLSLLCSGVLIFIPVGKLYEEQMFLTTGRDRFEIPYGLIVAAAGGCLAEIASLLLLVVCCKGPPVSGQVVVTSGQSMQMAPLVTTQAPTGQPQTNYAPYSQYGHQVAQYPQYPQYQAHAPYQPVALAHAQYQPVQPYPPTNDPAMYGAPPPSYAVIAKEEEQVPQKRPL